MSMVILQSSNGLTFVNGIGSVLLGMAPYVSLGCMVAAGVALRGEGGTNFHIGGGFSKWIMWSLIFCALPTIPVLMSNLGVSGLSSNFSGGGNEFSGMTTAAQSFVQTYIVSKLVSSIAGFLVLKAVLDAGEGNSPLPSLVSAIFVLSANGLFKLASGWVGTDAYGVTTGLSSALNYVGATVCPISAAFCFIGAVVQFIKGSKWGHLVLTGLALLSFTGIWALVQSWVTATNSVTSSIS
jgi:hypothetical protein